MPALKTQYLCQQCGAASPKWAGQCPSCDAWNTLVETVAQPRTTARAPSAARAMAGIASLTPIAVVESAEASRIATGLGEVDRVLGGGFVPGSIALFGGDPGIGKSTLLLQVAGLLAARGLPVLYLTGEESPGQVRGRAERVGAVVDGLQLAATTELETALAAIEAASPGPGRRRQRPDPDQRRPGRPGRQRRAGPRGGVATRRGREDLGHRRRPRRSRHEGGHGRRAANARAPRRRGDLPRGGAPRLDPPPARGQEPIRVNRRGRRAGDAWRRARGGEGSEPLLPGVGRGAERRRRDHDRAGGDASARRRDPGAVRDRRLRVPPPRHDRAST